MSELLHALGSAVPAERMSTRAADLDAAARDESSLLPHRPEVVVWALSTEEVAAVVRLAGTFGVALTARGAGSSLEGNPIPLRGGIVLDLSRMDRIGEIRPDDLQVDVEPGVVYAQLNRQLRSHGLFFPPSPGGSSDVATIGGMAANNASGIYSVKYGGTRQHVRAATLVTGAGEVVHLGNRCRKHSTGYDLLDLVVGSEGTLGILTEITLSLAGLPQESDKLAYAFPSDREAARAIAALLRFGVDLAAAEFLDAPTMAAVNRFRPLELAERPTLLLEVHGSAATLADQRAAVEALVGEHGGESLALPAHLDPWKEIRHWATRAVQALDPQSATVRGDFAVPLSALADLVAAAAAAGARHSCKVFVFGHAGIGILHILIPARRDSPQWSAAEAAKLDLVDFVGSVGGAVSGEHGMGLGNRAHAAAALGSSLELMKRIKAVFDPHGILNPGKIWES